MLQPWLPEVRQCAAVVDRTWAQGFPAVRHGLFGTSTRWAVQPPSQINRRPQSRRRLGRLSVRQHLCTLPEIAGIPDGGDSERAPPRRDTRTRVLPQLKTKSKGSNKHASRVTYTSFGFCFRDSSILCFFFHKEKRVDKLQFQDHSALFNLLIYLRFFTSPWSKDLI